MKSVLIGSFIGVAVATALAVGCSSAPAPSESGGPAESTGSAGMTLSLYDFQNDQDCKSFPNVDYTISRTNPAA